MVKNDVCSTLAHRTKDGSVHRRCGLDMACCGVFGGPECPLSVAESSSNIDEQPPRNDPSKLPNGFEASATLTIHFGSPGDIISKTQKFLLHSSVGDISSY